MTTEKHETDAPTSQAQRAPVTLADIDAAAADCTPTLREAIEEIEREIRHRCRLYPEWVRSGRYKIETAAAKLAALRRAQTQLAWVEHNLDWIKAEAERRRRDVRLAAEAQALRDEPAVSAVLDAFPDAEISVREMSDQHAA